jgi:hypothetical protein
MKSLSEVFNYDSETGLLKRKIAAGGLNVGDVAGTKRPNGYVMVSINNKQIRAHRVAWEMYYNEKPNGCIDHINGIRDDNRIVNLRVVSVAENNRNLSINSRNKTGVTGVSWESDRQKWVAFIGVNKGKHLKIGRFDNLLDACCARKSAEIVLGYHTNHGKAL